MGISNAFFETLSKKNLVVIDDFISEQLCSKILEELEWAVWQPSSVIVNDGNDKKRIAIAKSRVSMTAHSEFFNEKLEGMIIKIENQVADLIDSDPIKFERWQGTKYPIGGKFDFHLDCGSWAKDKAGERKRTILLYLDMPKQGGSTVFRALNLKIVPRVGRLIIWNNLLPSGDCNYGMIHAGMPLWKGKKTTLVTWERQKNYRTHHP